MSIRFVDKKAEVMLSGVPSWAKVVDGTESKHPVRALMMSRRLSCIPRDPSLCVGPPLCPTDAAFRMTFDFENLLCHSTA